MANRSCRRRIFPGIWLTPSNTCASILRAAPAPARGLRVKPATAPIAAFAFRATTTTHAVSSAVAASVSGQAVAFAIVGVHRQRSARSPRSCSISPAALFLTAGVDVAVHGLRLTTECAPRPHPPEPPPLAPPAVESSPFPCGLHGLLSAPPCIAHMRRAACAALSTSRPRAQRSVPPDPIGRQRRSASERMRTPAPDVVPTCRSSTRLTRASGSARPPPAAGLAGGAATALVRAEQPAAVGASPAWAGAASRNSRNGPLRGGTLERCCRRRHIRCRRRRLALRLPVDQWSVSTLGSAQSTPLRRGSVRV